MNWQDKRVFITGISGFAGSHLADYLAHKGAKVYALIRQRKESHSPRNVSLNQLSKPIELLIGDLLDPVGLGKAIDAAAPDVIFHLAAHAFVPYTFLHPKETYETNVLGTLNLLEAIRVRQLPATVVFTGSSEEYGLVFTSEQQYRSFVAQHGDIFPAPRSIPELPINENNPLRPMSPYGVSKVQADLLASNYCLAYGLRIIISRAFNHDGARRGGMFVTPTIAGQLVDMVKESNKKGITIGNVNSFRDWSHVNDLISGLCLLAEKGLPGEVYNQGSQRTNSILSYILLGLEELGEKVLHIESFKNGKKVIDPLEQDETPIWGCSFPKSKVDSLMLNAELSFDIEDEGIWVFTESGKIPIYFDSAKFRPLEIPVLLADISKIRRIGFQVEHSFSDIVRDQINYFLTGKSLYPMH